MSKFKHTTGNIQIYETSKMKEILDECLALGIENPQTKKQKVICLFSQIKNLNDEDLANATLYKAAPEMLELLIEIGKFGEELYPDDPDTGLFGYARKMAEKATGLTWAEIQGEQ